MLADGALTVGLEIGGSPTLCCGRLGQGLWVGHDQGAQVLAVLADDRGELDDRAHAQGVLQSRIMRFCQCATK